jgi:hypothetical protein
VVFQDDAFAHVGDAELLFSAEVEPSAHAHASSQHTRARTRVPGPVHVVSM